MKNKVLQSKSKKLSITRSAELKESFFEFPSLEVGDETLNMLRKEATGAIFKSFVDEVATTLRLDELAIPLRSDVTSLSDSSKRTSP